MINPQQIAVFRSLMMAWREGDQSIKPAAHDLLIEMGFSPRLAWIHFGRDSECRNNDCSFAALSSIETLETMTHFFEKEIQNVRGNPGYDSFDPREYE